MVNKYNFVLKWNHYIEVIAVAVVKNKAVDQVVEQPKSNQMFKW